MTTEPGAILLVEDDEFIRDSVGALLRQEGYDIQACASLEDARGALRRRLPRLVILDVLLPDGSGFELCRQIRESCAVPILFLTCCDEDEDTVRGLEYGGDDYVGKPFRARVLLSRVKALLRRSEGNPAEGPQTDIFHFDRDKRVCTAAGVPLPLTPIEYRLLYELAKRAGEVVPRETLLHAIWELGSDYLDENTLSVHISRLRGKLGPYSEKLSTVRGEGYRLRCADE